MTRSKSERGFGFRELEYFNIALLGKMSSRIMSEPNSLWVKVLKGLYFLTSNFLQVVKGSKLSWAWTSMLLGRNAVKNGVVWVIGDGRSIRPFTGA